MSEHPIVVIGGVNADLQGRSFRRFHPKDSNPGIIRFSAGGVARNIAENLVRLAQPSPESPAAYRVELISVLGDDAISQQLVADCKAKVIGLKAALTLPGSTAAQYVCLLDEDGRLIGAVADMENFERLSPDHLQHHTSLLDHAPLMIIDCNLPEATIGWLAKRYHPQFANPSHHHRLPLLGLDTVSVAKAGRARNWLSSFTFIKPNLEEAKILAGMSPQDDISLKALSERLHQAGARQLFITCGEAGIFYSAYTHHKHQQGWAHVNSQDLAQPPVINVSGAGDAACAAIGWGILHRYSPGHCADWAVAAARLTCASDQTVHPQFSIGKINALIRKVHHE